MTIGITGTDGAGKGTVVQYLVEVYGFTHYSSRDLILAEIEKQGLQPTRNQMRLTANELRKEFGNEVIVKKALEKAKEEKKDNIIIESIRALAEAEYLDLHGGILLAVDADPKVRFERIRSRQSATDQVTYDEFIAQEELEKNDPDPNGMQKAKVMERAKYTIINDGSIEDLGGKINKFLEKYR